MTKEEVVSRVREIGIIPAARLSSAEDALFAAEAVSSGGIPIVEVTLTVPGALEVVHHLARSNPDLVVGAGTVLDLDTAHRCLDAGAKFLTSPALDLDVVRFAVQQGVNVFSGALTPSEVLMAWKAGCDFVKIYPCGEVGGASYIKTLRRPFPQIPLIGSGGVNQQNAASFILAGSVAIGIGADLMQPEAIAHRERDWIRELAQRFLKIVGRARSESQIRIEHGKNTTPAH
jgi:2-dehydro-3-deoxyphosphogluconate aldolase / (4S)-4-hydroxy-2-oxoglutarate aldolase